MLTPTTKPRHSCPTRPPTHTTPHPPAQYLRTAGVAPPGRGAQYHPACRGAVRIHRQWRGAERGLRRQAAFIPPRLRPR